MTGEPPLAQQQQRAVVELYVRSKWIKASLALEDENLFIEYAHNKRDQQTPTGKPNVTTTNNAEEATQNNGSTTNDTPDTITSQKRIIKIVKPDNTGLGRNEIYFDFFFFIVFFSSRNKYQRWSRESNANINK
jgi:hypothetical protein